MEKFDVLVVGSGSGMNVAAAAVAVGMETALVEFGPMGGTCLNRGCIPSKMLIYAADVAAAAEDAGSIGVRLRVDSVDFSALMSRMRHFVTEDSESQARSVEASPDITWFKERGEFISDYMMKVGSQIIKADRIYHPSKG
jgi:dihydrolipoamide dehydrogenase